MGKGKQDGESGSGKGDKDSSSARRRPTKWDQKPLEDKSQGQDGQPKRPGFRLPEQGDQRVAVIRSGLRETDGVLHHRRNRLSRVMDGAPHKTRHRMTVRGELRPHRRQAGADGGHQRRRREMAADGAELPGTLDMMGHRRRLGRSAGHLMARHRRRHQVLHRKAGRLRRPCRRQ